MKKILLTLAMTSFFGLATVSCQPPNPAGGASSGGATFASKSDFVKFANCIKANGTVSTDSKAGVDNWLNELNSVSEAQWPSVAAIYAAKAQAYMVLGCK
jgi:hypothetical protein